jgi:hypothetical protein
LRDSGYTGAVKRPEHADGTLSGRSQHGQAAINISAKAACCTRSSARFNTPRRNCVPRSSTYFR